MNMHKKITHCCIVIVIACAFCFQSLQGMKRKDEEIAEANKKRKFDSAYVCAQDPEASLMLNRGDKPECHWPELDKKKLMESDMYLTIKKLERNYEKNEELKKFMKVFEHIETESSDNWILKRSGIAAALLAGTGVYHHEDDHYITSAIKNNDGWFIYFVATECNVRMDYLWNPAKFCKTVAMLKLLESLGVDLKSDYINIGIISDFFKKNCKWQVIQYCIEHELCGYARGAWCDRSARFNNWFTEIKYPEENFHTGLELYNHLKKLQVLFESEIISVDAVKKYVTENPFILTIKNSKNRTHKKNLIIYQQALISPKYWLPLYLELYGDDYGDFPARKIYGQQAFNPNFFDCAFIYKRLF